MCTLCGCQFRHVVHVLEDCNGNGSLLYEDLVEHLFPIGVDAIEGVILVTCFMPVLTVHITRSSLVDLPTLQLLSTDSSSSMLHSADVLYCVMMMWSVVVNVRDTSMYCMLYYY